MLEETNQQLYPNIDSILRALLLIPVTSGSVHYVICHKKLPLHSMGEERLNALM